MPVAPVFVGTQCVPVAEAQKPRIRQIPSTYGNADVVVRTSYGRRLYGRRCRQAIGRRRELDATNVFQSVTKEAAASHSSPSVTQTQSIMWPY